MSAKRVKELEEVLRGLSLPLEEEERKQDLSRIRTQRVERRQRKQVAVGCSLTLAAGVLLGYLSATPSETMVASKGIVASQTSAHGAEARCVQRGFALSDSSQVHVFGGKIEVIQDNHEGTVLNLTEGRSRFAVRPVGNRYFRVHSGSLQLEVIGTEFDVERGKGAEAERVAVQVLEGRVRIVTNEQMVELVPSMGKMWFGTKHMPSDASDSSKSAKPAWRALADRKKFREAWDKLKEGAEVRDRVDDLLRASDVARNSGHQAEAVPYLEAILRRHRKDKRAAIAAFTLGKVQARRGKKAAAAKAFGDVRILAPKSDVAELALARQALALHSAGKASQAQSLARAYLSSFPKGMYANDMRQIVGN